jgi:ferredoxin-NADP reductase
LTKFHRLEVGDIRRETADSVSVGFRVPPELAEDYRYKQGQYLTLRLELNGEEVRRSYSICSAPHETGELRIGVKAVPGGRMSTYINEVLKVGDTIEVMTPMGTFTSGIDPTHSIRYILIAGGSGITPMLSILKTVLFAEPQSSVLLLYANRNAESVMFRSALDELSSAYKERLKVKHLLDAAPENYPAELTGIMTKEKLAHLLDMYDTSGGACSNHVKYPRARSISSTFPLRRIRRLKQAKLNLPRVQRRSSSKTAMNTPCIYPRVKVYWMQLFGADSMRRILVRAEPVQRAEQNLSRGK